MYMHMLIWYEGKLCNCFRAPLRDFTICTHVHVNVIYKLRHFYMNNALTMFGTNEDGLFKHSL